MLAEPPIVTLVPSKPLVAIDLHLKARVSSAHKLHPRLGRILSRQCILHASALHTSVHDPAHSHQRTPSASWLDWPAVEHMLATCSHHYHTEDPNQELTMPGEVTRRHFALCLGQHV